MEDPEKYNIGIIYARKNCTNFFKLIYYTLITIFGIYVLSDQPYFPWQLLGKGEISNCFKGGFPNWIYHQKPDYFNIYYLGVLAFHISDLIWLLFVYELQTDFLMMLVHHICTISLITFSYLTNYSNIGSIIIFLHDFGDIFVYIARIFLNTKAPEFTKSSSGILLLLVWIYTRLFVFGGIINALYIEFSLNHSWINWNILLFLCFLYLLHMYWIYLIFKKICAALFVNKYEDTFKVKKIR